MSRSFGLNEQEKQGARKLLGQLPTPELLSLSQTVTNRQIIPASKQEAIRAIVTYTESATGLLKRRKLKRDVLFQYLHSEGAVVSAQAEKHQLIRAVLQLWGSKIEENLVLLEDEEPDQPEPPNPVAAQKNVSENHQLATQFAVWFYKMLNSQHLLSADPSASPFGPQHFFKDCAMKLLCTAPEPRLEHFSGADAVSQRLLAFIREESVKFNPNVEADGLSGISDPHGRRIVTVCGTVHQSGNVVGLFEQQFGLVRDPDMQGNFRIRFVNLKIGVGQPSGRPTLETTERLLALKGT